MLLCNVACTMVLQEMEMDTLHGCTKCRFNASGCGACRDAPILERPKSVRWKPDAARPQTSVPSAPTFYPTPEEFEDPVAYINKIRPEGEKCVPALDLPAWLCGWRCICSTQPMIRGMSDL